MRKKLKNHFVPHKGNKHIPHLLSSKSVMAGLCLACLIQLSVLGAIFLPKLVDHLAAVLPSVVTLLTNEARAENSLPALTENTLLVKAAQAKANDMAEKGYFAHQSPDGREPWDWISGAGYKYSYAGENLAVNFTDSEEVVSAWQKSPTHNLNLMGPRYTEIGVAMAEGVYKGREAVFVVQMFASPSQVATASKPHKPQTAIARAEINSVPTEESIENPVLGAVSESVEPVSSGVQRVASSPRTYGGYALGLLSLLFFIPLIVGWGRHHPKALANGAVAVAVLAGVIFANGKLLFPDLELPVDAEHSASVILSQ